MSVVAVESCFGRIPRFGLFVYEKSLDHFTRAAIILTQPRMGGKLWMITRKTSPVASPAGHLKGVQRMVEDDIYCIDVIQQIQAAEAGLDKVKVLILDNHLHTCVTTAIRGMTCRARANACRDYSVF